MMDRIAWLIVPPDVTSFLELGVSLKFVDIFT
jgi:hypothetical protein